MARVFAGQARQTGCTGVSISPYGQHSITSRGYFERLVPPRCYHAFNISDPKPRNIHKATVRDRLLHHTIYRVLYPSFEWTFISDSFSCRNGKGVHAALNRFRAFSRVASQNNTKTCWVLKCDIRKFFASINHGALLAILRSYIPDDRTSALLQEVIGSFSSTAPGVGLPLGNLTSQLFVNVYMNEFDQFVKHKLKAKHYIRYADDFVVFSPNREWLNVILPKMDAFLRDNLKLTMHPDKVFVETMASGVDFLGWVHFPDHRVLRTATKRRAIKRTEESKGKPEVVQAYLGLLKHGNTRKLEQKILLRNSFATSDIFDKISS